MASGTVRLFVYGSLKRGGLHHGELTALGALFVAEAETRPGYRLEALGEYLALVPVDPPVAPTAADTQIVSGELFEMPAAALPALDAFEGDAYTRAVVKVRLPSANAVKAQYQEHPEKIAEEAVDKRALAYFKKAR